MNWHSFFQGLGCGVAFCLTVVSLGIVTVLRIPSPHGQDLRQGKARKP